MSAAVGNQAHLQLHFQEALHKISQNGQHIRKTRKFYKKNKTQLHNLSGSHLVQELRDKKLLILFFGVQDKLTPASKAYRPENSLLSKYSVFSQRNLNWTIVTETYLLKFVHTTSNSTISILGRA